MTICQKGKVILFIFILQCGDMIFINVCLNGHVFFVIILVKVVIHDKKSQPNGLVLNEAYFL